MGNSVESMQGKWLIVFGILLMISGLILVAMPVYGTLASLLVLGSLLIVGGIIHIIAAFLNRQSNNFWMHLLIAVFTLVVGLLILYNPTATALTLTLLIAAFFFSIGLFRILSSIIVRFKSWGWVLLNGIISFLLGLLIIIHWPVSALWVIGLFVGIDFLFAGFSLLMIARLFKTVPPASV